MKKLLVILRACLVLAIVASSALSCKAVDLGARKLVLEEVMVVPGSVSMREAQVDVTVKASLKEETEEEAKTREREEKKKEEEVAGKGNFNIVVTGTVHLTVDLPVVGPRTLSVPFKRVIAVDVPQVPEPTPGLPKLPR